MNHRPEIFKMAQLREKTDRELVRMIGSRLDEGLRSARARDEAARLVAFVSNAAERRALETRLARLNEEIEARDGVRAMAAS